MHLDLPTLMLCGAFVALTCSIFFAYSWWQYRQTTAALWWGSADLLYALSLTVMAFTIGKPATFTVLVASLALLVVAPVQWAGMRVFDGKPIPFGRMALGPFIVAVITLPTGLWSDGWLFSAMQRACAACYLAAAAWEVYERSKVEWLSARAPMTVVTLLHSATLMATGWVFLAISDTSTLPFSLPLDDGVIGAIHLEGLIFSIGTMLFLVAMTKSRMEASERRNAQTDALTGLPNRRALSIQAERIAAQCREEGRPIAVVAFDLDRFKDVNDRFGHATGDRVLTIFAATARSMIRPNDMISRIGGEEFVAILPGLSVEDGRAMAERIRIAFEAVARDVDGHAISATVSAGVVSSEMPVDALLEIADQLLYQAKLKGRNRVECMSIAPATTRKLARVA